MSPCFLFPPSSQGSSPVRLVCFARPAALSGAQGSAQGCCAVHPQPRPRCPHRPLRAAAGAHGDTRSLSPAPQNRTCVPDTLCWPEQLGAAEPPLCSPDRAAHARALRGGNEVLTSMLHRHSSNFVTTSENSGLPCEHNEQSCVKSSRRRIVGVN